MGAAEQLVVVGPGIYLRNEMRSYESIEGVNYSTLKEMARSPRHYQHTLSNRRTETKSMSKGTAAHIAILEPARFVREYAVFDGPRRAGKAWEEFESANADKTILKEDEFMQAIAMRDAVLSDPIAAPYFANGDHEVTMVWDDSETGMRCKGRADYVTRDNVLVDLKTTRDASPHWFSRDFAKLQYHVQSAFYLDALETLIKRPARAVVVAVEANAPHDVVVYSLDEDVIGPGRDAYRQMLARIKECRAEKSWPGVANGNVIPMRLPPWLTQNDDDMSALGLE